ncbi:MATE family efflux transporter [Konateibacter massiliensis]|uniref:MATE family efflux transporter n=1 Tax=Konateibacter massiliensis TaxID=2002841 RepID=UPI0015D51471|nr:MATE family efflux transporter [Konateibacter massiliensis]
MVKVEEQSVHVMEKKEILPLLLSNSIPPMISMLIQSLYNIVDSIFVAKLGEDAITAVSIVFPLQNLVLAIAVGLGVGINACMAINMGAKNKETVNLTASNGIVLTVFHSLLLLLIGLFLVKPYLEMFTNNEQVLKWALEYGQIVICFSFGSLFHINIEKMFQASGNMFVPMILQGVGAIINIILAPILIFGMFGLPALEVRGAAIATVIAQMTACLLAVISFAIMNKEVHISLKKYKLKWSMVKRIYSIAIPSAIMMSLPSILISILNGILGSISNTAVAVFGLYYKLQTFVYMPATGLIQGMRPIISYNYGAGRYDRLKKTVKVSLIVAGVIMAIGTVIFMGAPKLILSMFSATEEMNAIGVGMLRIISCGFIVSSVGIIYSGLFEALGKGRESLIISLLRQLVVTVGLTIVLSRFMGLTGVWISFPIAEGIAAVFAILLIKKEFKSFEN